jgi:hypothetical protein
MHATDYSNGEVLDPKAVGDGKLNNIEHAACSTSIYSEGTTKKSGN